MSARVYAFSPIDAAIDSYERLQQFGCEVVAAPRPWVSPMDPSADELVAQTRGADALVGSMIYNTAISADVLDSSDRLRIVAKYSIGCEDVDIDAATERGILVTYGPTESNWGGVAEGTLANILCLLKKLRERDAHLKTGGLWRAASLTGTYLGARQDGYPGISIGIVGLGRVGSRLADLLRPWNIRVLACDPYVADETFAAHGVTRTDLATLLAEADVVTMHVYLNRQTRHLIGAPELARMKPDAVFINASRGGIVDEPALISALQNGRLAAAALDVFEREPLPLDSPLRQLGDRVLLSPHMVTNNVGSGTGPAIVLATDAILDAFRGDVPRRDIIFNPEVIPAWQARFAGQDLLATPVAAR
ncbi:MAG TPA: NAD(P)-dependent oxidoreductase [Chloroflexota bacterium]|nr:NAD(P)-dependent oxidoreductase [Chloroflexota bacterium]